TIDVHLHLPAGAQKKDGPSAGVAVVHIRTLFPPISGYSTRGLGRYARWYRS
ncbi:hypothetical protein EDB86DRAFT_2890192, partial [Lactarius hatsudake]